jgi:23S rRNA pseudouridine2605 synthase
MRERWQKVLAAAGIASRRTCEEFIAQGRVSVNGKVVRELGSTVDLSVDKLVFDGRAIKRPERYYYIVLNKPRGVASTVSDPHASRTVVDLVDLQAKPFLRPVGRLDLDSEGLILLTDDGDFLYKVTHPKHHIGKTYRVVLKGVPDTAAMAALNTGVKLDDGITQPAKDVRLKRVTREVDGPGRSEVELTIFEGKNRQVRRMFAALGCPVQRLTRIRIGDVRLTDLPPGGWRHLTQNEISSLLRQASGEDTNKKETDKQSWRTKTAPQPSKPAKAPLSQSSTKPKRPIPPATSSVSRKAGSTTASRSTATSRVL